MKKSFQTIMTAAVFAAALSAGAGDTLAAQSLRADAETVTAVPQTTYGPPVWLTEPEATTTDELLREEGVAPIYTDPTTTLTLAGTSPIPEESALQLAGEQTIPEIATTLALAGTSVVPQLNTTTSTCTTLTMEGTTPLVTEPELEMPGEAPLYNEAGDLDRNGSLDARDLSLLKQYLLIGQTYKTDHSISDVNGDGNIDKEDVKALIRLLTGKPEDEEEQPETTPVTTEELLPTTTTIPTTICTLYGPPPAWQ